MNPEAVEQYNRALKAGQKYYKDAVLHGTYPYPLVLDEILSASSVAGNADLGIINIPPDRVVGTKTAGRISAMAGNFMPLLTIDSEFAAKWTRLCDAHLSDEGIRDPIECFEYLGRFYIQEGNKRFSVLLSFDAPSVTAHVTRIIPCWSEDHEVQVYYEFMHFYSLSGLYSVEFHHRGSYDRLQAALGFEPEHVWSEGERRSFSAGFRQFCNALEKYKPDAHGIFPAEALLVWLQVFSFSDIKELSVAEVGRRLEKLWPDVLTQFSSSSIELSTEPEQKEKSVVSKLLSLARPDHLNVAFLYASSPGEYTWTRAHDDGRKYLERRFCDRVDVHVYRTDTSDYGELIEQAVSDGAELIFATAAPMISACRKAAALHKDIKILNCALFQPYTGVRMYNGRTYECKFITGAIAGAMEKGDRIGYVANSPVFGTPASINAYALGAQMTHPGIRVKLDWSCLPGDPVQRLIDTGIRVISNREIPNESLMEKNFELGTFQLHPDGTLRPLVSPCWYWGKLYEKIVLSIFSGAWNDISSSKAIHYWWGMASGVLDILLSPSLPDGPRLLGEILREGICNGTVSPFQGIIHDQNGVLRNSGRRPLSPEEILSMDWLCDNVDGSIPELERLRPEYEETIRTLGLYRQRLLPNPEGSQL